MRYSHQKPTLGEDVLMTSVSAGRVAGEIPLSPAGRTAEHRARTLLCNFEIIKVPFRDTIA